MILRCLRIIGSDEADQQYNQVDGQKQQGHRRRTLHDEMVHAAARGTQAACILDRAAQGIGRIHATPPQQIATAQTIAVSTTLPMTETHELRTNAGIENPQPAS